MAPESGEFTRDTAYIPDRITRDARDGWPVEAGRYRLVAARACPWANRAVIARRLLGLEDAISLGLCGPTHDEHSWRFDLDPGMLDPVLGYARLEQAYLARFPDYGKGITVPTMVDVPSRQVVTNDFRPLVLDLMTEWQAFHRAGAPDLYPAARRDEIDELVQVIYTDVNNAVYQCGFATVQAAYDHSFRKLFNRLDRLSERLSKQRYLMGDTITEPDINLFSTLVRFDAVYHGHFKCNRQKLTELPVLWAYARDLFQTPGFGDTIDFDQIKEHYYVVHDNVNPSGIVPLGPDESGWTSAHGREELGGRPFGDGTPPEPPAASETVGSVPTQ